MLSFGDYNPADALLKTRCEGKIYRAEVNAEGHTDPLRIMAPAPKSNCTPARAAFWGTRRPTNNSLSSMSAPLLLPHREETLKHSPADGTWLEVAPSLEPRQGSVFEARNRER